MIENAETRSLLGSISAVLSCAVYAPPRKEFGGREMAPFPNSGW